MSESPVVRQLLLLLLLWFQQEAWAAWKYSRKANKQHGHYQNDAATYGPNVCAVQEVFRTGEKFYPDCLKKRLKRACGRPTFLRYECCCGYGVLEGEKGCPTVQPLRSIHQTLLDMGVKEFPRLLTNTELEYKLKSEGAFTVFIPVDEAYLTLTEDQKLRLFPWTYNALTLLYYHIAPGWHHSENMGKNEHLPTLYYGLKPAWITRPSKKHMFTVNCARMIKSNILATNGVIHLIDKWISPYDQFGNITDVMFRDTGQFSKFVKVLYTSQLVTMLREEGPFTLFAPSNYAFSRLSPLVLDRVLHDSGTAIAFIRHHVAKGVHCSSGNVDKSSIRLLDGSKLNRQCKKNGHYFSNSRIVKADILAGNGLIHLINKVQMPFSIQTVEEVARELRLNKFLQLSFQAGLLDKLQTGTEMTMFIPTDEAFHVMKKRKKAEDIHVNDADVFEQIFDYHRHIGKIRTDSFVGDHGLIMSTGDVMKIVVHRDGILMDDASIVVPNTECLNGVIHVVDRVLLPPHRTLHQIIDEAEDLSILKKGLEYSKLYKLLQRTDRSLTVFAPTDQAFNKLPLYQIDAIFDDDEKLKMLIQHHIVDRILIDRSISPRSLLHVKSLQEEKMVFYRSEDDKYTVDKYSDIVEPIKIAKNGVLYKIDRVLECDCKKDPS